ncbi:MAG: hypothetical protein E7675_01520 [Ruminococcaceae bacterium]|nr:hypothetical protein [Oscillospiraceae bacterium]
MNVKNKLVIVINGKGGVGKDAMCVALESAYAVKNVSAITPIKNIASQYGWNGEKDPKSRRFLAELKRVFVEYNDLPTKYLLEQYEEFLQDDHDIMVVHIREKAEISKFIKGLRTPVVSILVKRSAVDNAAKYGNSADDEVENYNYDHVFYNDHSLEESSARFVEFIKDIEKEIFGKIK